MERSSRVLIGVFGTTSILPPRCMRKVRSETCSTSTPSTTSIAAVTAARCSASSARTLTSRTFVPRSTRTRSIAPSDAPASPIADARRAKAPGRSSSRTRTAAENEADGCDTLRRYGRTRARSSVRPRFAGAGNYAGPAMRVTICDVGPRDGLQNEPETLAPATRAELVSRLAATGVPRVEAASFVRPDAVPQMAGAEEVAAAIERRDGAAYAGLVLNEKGFERLRGTELDEVHVSFGVTETFNRRNANASVEESLDATERIVGRAREAQLPTAVSLSVAFGCPFEGRVDPGRVLDLAERVSAAGADEVVLADTIGVAVPRQVRQLVADSTRLGRRVGDR